MGNAMFYCMLRPESTVRLIQPDGEVLEFDRQVMAKQLMKLYQGHSVVHCSHLSRLGDGGLTFGLRGAKVTLLRPEKMLLLGQTYCLLRVPNAGTHVHEGPMSRMPGNSKSVQREICGKDLKRVTLRGLIYGTASDVHVYEKEIAGRIQRHFAHPDSATIFPTAAATRFNDQSHARRLRRRQRHAKRRRSRSWKPELDPIMESPLNINVPPSQAQRIIITPYGARAGIVLVSSSEQGREALVMHEASGYS